MGINKYHYNIPSNNRELQPIKWLVLFTYIITYQVITGNYSTNAKILHSFKIITYQVITGNYSSIRLSLAFLLIITYQVITGNYSTEVLRAHSVAIITYQVITGNYSLCATRKGLE